MRQQVHLRPRIREAVARPQEVDADDFESREQSRDLLLGVRRHLGRDQADPARQALWELAHRLHQHADVSFAEHSGSISRLSAQRASQANWSAAPPSGGSGVGRRP